MPNDMYGGVKGRGNYLTPPRSFRSIGMVRRSESKHQLIHESIETTRLYLVRSSKEQRHLTNENTACQANIKI